MAEKKSIHEFQTGTPQATTAFLVDTPNTSAESGYVTEKVITSDLGNTLLGTLNYTQSLNTESKNIFGAVNELNENSVNFEEKAIPDIPTRELPYYPSGEYSDLNTTDKHIIGAINEVKSNTEAVESIVSTKQDDMAKGQITNTNLNTLRTNGNYYLTGVSSANNAPINDCWGLMEVLASVIIIQRITQVGTSGVGVSVYERLFINNNWTSWKKITRTFS